VRRTRRSTALPLTTLLLLLVGLLLPAAAAQAVGTSTIRGAVLVTGGEPGVGVVVDLYARTDPAASWESVDTTTTDELGHYELSDVAPGTYRVGFDDPTGVYEDEYWSNFSSLEDSDDLVVGPGELIEDVNAFLNAPYVPGPIRGAITGTVDGLRTTDAVKVSAYQLVDGAWSLKGFIWTGFDGTFRLNLPPGSYRIGFTEEQGELVPEFWNDVASLDLAADIEVLEDTVTPGRNAILTPAPGSPVPPSVAPVAPVAPVPAVPVASTPFTLADVTRPAITGRAKVGMRLRASGGSWMQDPGVSVTYRWLADGRIIKKATRDRLRVIPALVGKRIRVRVTARTADAKVVVISRRTPKVVA
jgi:hypothetical protein